MPEYVNLVCPSCDAVSRMPQLRAKGAGARCDQCGAPLFLGRSIALDDPIRFQKHIVSNDIPALVVFWTPWCGACRLTVPELEEAAPDLEPAYRIATVDTDKAPEIQERYGVQAIPAMILFSRGREIGRWNGTIRAAAIARFAAEHFAAGAETESA